MHKIKKFRQESGDNQESHDDENLTLVSNDIPATVSSKIPAPALEQCTSVTQPTSPVSVTVNEQECAIQYETVYEEVCENTPLHAAPLCTEVLEEACDSYTLQEQGANNGNESSDPSSEPEYSQVTEEVCRSMPDTSVEECQEVMVDVCEDEPEEVCDTVMEKHCRTVQEETCEETSKTQTV